MFQKKKKGPVWGGVYFLRDDVVGEGEGYSTCSFKRRGLLVSVLQGGVDRCKNTTFLKHPVIQSLTVWIIAS